MNSSSLLSHAREIPSSSPPPPLLLLLSDTSKSKLIMEKTSKFSSFSGREDSHQVHRNLSLNINADNLKPSKLDEQNEKIKEINQLACVFQQIDDFLLEKNPETTTLPLVAVDCLLIFVDCLIIDGKINDEDPKDTDNDNDG